MIPIFDWREASEAGPLMAGGKGWQLGRLAQLGVAVPDGFVIGSAASTDHLPGETVRGDLVQALAKELERRGWSDQPLAIRSSAAAEDSESASFAGIHRSFLNVRGPDAAQAVKEVWDSAWSSQALSYRQHLGIAEGKVGMAVVVMPLLSAVASGIAFTCDPISGRDDQLVIHANWGFGEALVSGQADGDEYRLQESYQDDSLHLMGQRLGSKKRITVTAASGGTMLCDTPIDKASQVILTSTQALQLGELIRDAAVALDYVNARYDIEWVWDGQHFWIIQARPITACTRYTYPALSHQPAYWSRGNTREVLPHPLSPMEWGLSRTMVNRMLTRGYELSGYRLLPGAQHAGLFHGRLYLQTSLMQWEAYDSLGIPPKAVNQLMGGLQPEITVPPATLEQRWARVLRMMRYLRRSAVARRYAEKTLKSARQRAAAWLAQDLPTENGELAKLLRTQFNTVRGADDLFFLQGSAGGALFNLLELVEKYFPGEGHALTAALMAGGEPSITAQQGYELMELARIAACDAQALAWLRHTDRVGTDWQHQLPEASAFKQAFAAFLQRYGHRGIYETYLRNPRWREAPDYLFDNVVNLIDRDLASLRECQQKAAAAVWQRLRRGMPFWLWPIVRKLVKASTVECNQREAARSALVAYVEVLRQGIIALGKRLTQLDGRDHPNRVDGLNWLEDIFNLTAPEMLALAEGRLPVSAAARRSLERRRQLKAWAAETEPEVVIEHGDYVAPAASTYTHGDESRDAFWRGAPVGSGRARGSVCIVRDPADGLALPAGAVLVAPSTDPAWTPLFLKAGALIMETGGYLSHGAIVAREFGIPAVVNLPRILEQLRDGDLVEVDGDMGTVRRL